MRHGQITEHRTPSAMQFAKDTDDLKNIEGIQDWVDEIGNDYSKVFDGTAAGRFCEFDWGYVRAMSRSTEMRLGDVHEQSDGQTSSSGSGEDDEVDVQRGY